MATSSPLLLYVPTNVVVMEAPVIVDIEDVEDVWFSVNVTGRVDVPLASAWPEQPLELGVLYDVPLYSCDDMATAHVLEELSL